MLLILPLLIGLAAVPLLGGNLAALLDVRFRRVWLLYAALATQVLVMSVLEGPATSLHHGLHLASYGLVGLFVVANRRLPFFGVLATGGGMNAAAIFANGGVMPARPGAVLSAGLVQSAHEFNNSTAVEGARLWLLGDVFAIPAGWPLSNVFSLGDIVLVLGAIVLIHRVCASKACLPVSVASPAPAVA